MEVQPRNNICAAVGALTRTARPSLGLKTCEDCILSAGFLHLNLRIEILDPLFIKDPFSFDLSQTWDFQGLGVLNGLRMPMGERLSLTAVYE